MFRSPSVCFAHPPLQFMDLFCLAPASVFYAPTTKTKDTWKIYFSKTSFFKLDASAMEKENNIFILYILTLSRIGPIFLNLNADTNSYFFRKMEFSYGVYIIMTQIFNDIFLTTIFRSSSVLTDLGMRWIFNAAKYCFKGRKRKHTVKFTEDNLTPPLSSIVWERF